MATLQWQLSLPFLINSAFFQPMLLTRASSATTLYPETSITSITILPTLPPYVSKPKNSTAITKAPTTQTSLSSSFSSPSILFFHFNSLKSVRNHTKMSNLDGNSSPKIHVETPPMAPSAPSENHRTPSTNVAGISGILRRWKREDLIKRGSLGLRGIALLFSLISFCVMASNKHGDWRNFDKYEEYRYLLAIAIFSTLYTGGQAFRQIRELSTGKKLLKPRMEAVIDFFGDQIIAYLLISSASSAVPLTNRMREGADNIFTDASAAAISMSIFAFLCLAVSALISGYKLSTQSYI